MTNPSNTPRSSHTIEVRTPAWKRAFDLAAASAGLIILSPCIAVVALLVRRNLGSPVIFRQTRPGLGGEPFEMMKFRSMRDATDADGNPLPDEERMTAFGAKLRDTSLDELPELMNVVRGDMSVVGPRPLLMHYLPLYSAEQMRRHEVRPGVTGLAQVSGRNAITWPEKFAKDLEYVDSVSLWSDLRIIFRTVAEVVSGSGVSAGDMAAGMEPFTGNVHDEHERADA